MIRQLRVRFIALSMGLLLLLLAAVVTVFNALNYRSVADAADKLLFVAAAHGGRLPGPEEFNYERFDPRFSPEAPEESRLFSVQLDGSGQPLYVNTGRVTRVDAGQALSYARDVLRTGRTQGFSGDYRFRAQANDAGTLIVFLDCLRSLSDFRAFLLTSVLITLLGYLIVFALTVVFSGRIVKPFADNYEKQKQFITNAGHELKTPLSIIGADADVLALEAGESEWLQDIRRQTDRLASLTDELVSLARMEELDLHRTRRSFSLTQAVTEAAQPFQAPALAQEKTLAVDAEPALVCAGDEAAIRQLVSILLDNALKHADRQGSVSLTLRRKGRAAQLAVENDAAGVDPEDLPHLFDRFYRADKARASTGGYGIGLSIARAIVSAHRGTIRASLPAPGRFRITAQLPL